MNFWNFLNFLRQKCARVSRSRAATSTANSCRKVHAVRDAFPRVHCLYAGYYFLAVCFFLCNLTLRRLLRPRDQHPDKNSSISTVSRILVSPCG